MAYTNAELVRMLLGDSGLAARDVTDGNGTTREFFLSTPPILGLSDQVSIGDTLKTRVADYTIDTTSGRLLFAVPVPQGTGNLVAVYKAVQAKDEDVAEACRQETLDPAAIAMPGEPAAAYRAAVMVAYGLASYYAGVDAALSAAWTARAEALSARTTIRTGLVAGAIKREDGYSQDRKATDVMIVGENPRRRYYGEPDRVP